MYESYLYLENGMIFEGKSSYLQKDPRHGEIVFSTGMTGYDASLTDPSYSGQILVFTYPLQGNYGIPTEEEWESAKVHVLGVVVSTACSSKNHTKNSKSLLDFLQDHQIPLIQEVDTRFLTKILRQHGTMRGSISSDRHLSYKGFLPPQETIMQQVTVKEKITYSSKGKRIIAVDCGMKASILRNLLKLPLQIERVPYHYDYSRDDYDGIFLSNGPGDPGKYVETIAILQKAMNKKKPIFGICLGAQILALASGAKTYKLHFGHRSFNQPCIDSTTGKCFITSQNHGYAICEKSLPEGWTVNFRNLNDGTVEGIMHKSDPFFAVQFHPEASPGPTDTEWLFEKFYSLLCEKS